MRVVSQFEENLIRILRAILGHGSLDAVQALLVRELSRPNCLGQDCIDIIQSDLSKGCVERLCRWGWSKEKFLKNGTAAAGRLWERTHPESRHLTFSSHTMDWLIWLTSVNYTQPAWLPPRPTLKKPLQLGDRLFLLLVLDTLQDSLGASILVKHPAIREDGLLWLLYADRFAETKGDYRGNFAFWMTDETVWILEASQDLLVERWEVMEASKQKLRDPEEMRRLGFIQELVLDDFLTSINEIHRRDLSRFILVAAEHVLHANAPQQAWYNALNLTSLRIADRSETYQAALTFLRSLKQLRNWQQSATVTTFYDENYQSSQFWKAEWERLNAERLCEQALAIEKQFEILKRVEA